MDISLREMHIPLAEREDHDHMNPQPITRVLFEPELEKWYNQAMSDSNRQIERMSALDEQGNEDDLRHTTIEERWNMMWQLTANAWAMKGEDIAG